MGRLSEVLGALPPPAYETVANHGNGTGKPFIKPRGLDASLVLMILSHLIDPKLSPEQQAIGYSNLHKNVRFASKDLYLLCMHLLRSKYIQRYMNRVRAPFTTDPYPAGQAIPSASEPVIVRSRLANPDALQSPATRRSGEGAGRETRILDLFVAASVRSDVESFESSLLESTLGDDEEGENDLFAYHQPKCRIEDLVIQRGRRVGVIRPVSSSITVTEKDVKAPPSYTTKQQNFASGTHNAQGKKWIEAEDLAIELRSKSAILRLRSDQSSSRALRTVFEVTRAREEILETTADRIVAKLAT
ncbi:uncharacterized protein FA14DRAFT_180853 [Meira miltonrushii]|uniref:Uncharacterized protein n=1 Tax=Meira miltonrushii TaxID=1280837 RepID=A0A316V9Q3_9BASI|nr:uncharacterized protein FA14DRAFT_180853 [Meira miltonrushii]PWN34226.1 hypothetical protein FA14DRAFT_180853 [Meira miltonrushii]